MATPQLSPGVIVREVDLTVGRTDNILDNIGAIAGPFSIGPVGEAIQVSTESELIQTFGKPISSDGQNGYWLSASTFLSYGGVLKVVRVDDPDLKNASAGIGATFADSLKIKNYEQYESTTATPTYSFAAQTPGDWGNTLKVAAIDDKADQIMGINVQDLGALGAQEERPVVQPVSGLTIPNTTGGTESFTGHIKGIITGVSTSTSGDSYLDVKVISRVAGMLEVFTQTGVVSVAATQPLTSGTAEIPVNSTAGLNINLNRVTIPSTSQTELVIASIDTVNNIITLATALTGTLNPGQPVNVLSKSYDADSGTETKVDYSESDASRSFTANGNVEILNSSGAIQSSTAISNVKDWYAQQKISLSTGDLLWTSIAPRPVSTDYANQRNSKGDAMHVAVFDDLGTISGIKANLLEKHLFVSKATDTSSTENAPLKLWWRDYLAKYSEYIYGGGDLSGVEDTIRGIKPAAIGFAAGTFTAEEDGWNQPAQDTTFKCIGNAVYDLGAGNNYSTTNGYNVDVSSVTSGYALFANPDEEEVDFLLMGPSEGDKISTQVKANYIISLAEARKDCMAVISPFTGDVVNESNSETQTNNVLSFFASLASSTYAVFDSGYKYTYDRFSSSFSYLPCNADVAGLMVRTAVNSYPWFSPAGTQRGTINNAVKLAYNPTKAQRDRLYANRINPVITQSGSGTILFGDKTAAAYASAFDRINVRRLFLTIEQAIQAAAKDQLFELNDELTRSNFVNIVDPYMRDIQAKRGVYDYLVVCDSTNNTPDIVDNNEFRADIYDKPTKSINYITLTFVATRTGVSFSEVAGRV